MRDARLARQNDRSDRYPRFGDDEYRARWERVRDLMEAQGHDAVIVYGTAGMDGKYVRYLADYSPNFSTYLVAFRDPRRDPTLFVGLGNHLQYVREKSVVDDLELSLPDPGEKLAARLRSAGVDGGTIGVVGGDPRYGNGMPHQHYAHLDRVLDARLVDATAEFASLTAVKSEAEIDRIRRAAAALDIAVEALEARAEAGLSEHELRAILSSAMAEEDAGIGATFLSTAPMTAPQPGECLPWKATPTDRIIDPGDVVTTEISAVHRGYASQLHRPFTVGVPPTDRYEEMFDLATETHERVLDAVRPGNDAGDVHEALAPIEASPYKIYDVAIHGYGNGYQHPFVGTSRSTYWPGVEDPVTAEWVFEENQVLVVQPNVVTPDERHGLQVGTTLVVRDGGADDLQATPVRFGRL